MPGISVITIGEDQWAVDVAISQAELEQGLGGLASIPAGAGMLFDLTTPQAIEVTTEPMLFNIDIIFISEGLLVVDIESNVAPGHLVSEATPVRYFLEVNAGEASDVSVGDNVTISDYSYTEPSIISQWMPSILQIVVLGLVFGMMNGMMGSMGGPKDATYSKKYLPEGIKPPGRVGMEKKKSSNPGNPGHNPGNPGNPGTTVTCPICGAVLEVPQWNKTSRSDVLSKHLEKECSSNSGPSTDWGKVQFYGGKSKGGKIFWYDSTGQYPLDIDALRWDNNIDDAISVVRLTNPTMLQNLRSDMKPDEYAGIIELGNTVVMVGDADGYHDVKVFPNLNAAITEAKKLVGRFKSYDKMYDSGYLSKNGYLGLPRGGA